MKEENDVSSLPSEAQVPYEPHLRRIPKPPDRHHDGLERVQDIDISPKLTESERLAVLNVLAKHAKVFRSQLGLLNDGSLMKITLKPDARPVNTPPYRNSPRARREIDKVFDELTKAGRLEPSSSPWASPVFVVYGHGDKARPVIDFRRVNQLVIRDAYPLPKQDEVLSAVAGARYISTLDLTKGFYQVPISPESRQYAAISSHRGLEQLTVCTMGYSNSPAHFQRSMNSLLAPYLWRSAIAYLDDLIIWSPSFSEHLRVLDEILTIIGTNGLTLSPSKAHIAYDEVTALGHRVGRLGLGTHREKTEAMRHLRRPETYKDLEAALGLFSYYRQFVPRFAQIAEPLYRMKTSLTKGLRVTFTKTSTRGKPKEGQEEVHHRVLQQTPLYWDQESIAAFEQLKERLCSAEVLAAPDFERPFSLYCDASYQGYGAALHQVHDGKERPVLYISRSLQAAEKNYAPTELECGCVVWALEKLSHYLDGSKVTVYTDGRALSWILDQKVHTNRKLARWATTLDHFRENLAIIHRPGRSNGNADGLSRLVPDPSPSQTLTTQATIADGVLRLDVDWARAYAEDPTWKTLYKVLLDKKQPAHGFSIDLDSKLYYVRDGSRLCVPRSELDRVIEHSHKQYGHQGVFKTYARLRDDFFHPQLKTRVAAVLKKCASCLQNRTMNHAEYGDLQPVLSEAVPFHTIAMDWVTGLPESGGFDAFLSVTCKFSKLVRIVPCRKDDGGLT